ncbi:hypothetical protein [Sphingomonas oligophenolica]|uniref:Uncharacterized protein n=1 Tax=Sphingomonas oligophenolica TaxID=301154 RepID=A0A502CSC0_9SPHN|nr:hypothetical protein [Sphingomonas oligophenolica]TPG15574.1 hypothetical protein EAH84_01905 [Sphingomonas oligophenolica]
MLPKSFVLIVVAAVSLAGCGPRAAPDPAPTAVASPLPTPPPPTAAAPDPAAGASERPASESKIPVAIRGTWAKSERDAAPTAADCADNYTNAGRVVRIEVDRIGYFETSALLESIDQISADYLRATFTERVGDSVSHSTLTLAVEDDGTRLTIRGPDSPGARSVTRYRRCPTA